MTNERIAGAETTSAVCVRVRRLEGGEGLPLPAPATADAAGADLRAAVATECLIEPGGRELVATGFAIELPRGYEAQVRPRSGLALRHGVTLVNSPGTIDADYRGEIGVILINHGAEPFIVKRGDRIAQLVVAPVPSAHFVEVEALADSTRGDGGFGSTGR